MDDKRNLDEITLRCFAKDPGEQLVSLPTFPCKKEACERYTMEYPYCVQMSRVPRCGREYP
jgi:hypothetical protein